MQIVIDLYYIFKGKFGKKTSNSYAFAFLVHSRTYHDMYRKYPQLKWVPKRITKFLMNHLWPITLSRVTGVNSVKNKQEVQGFVLGITMTAEQMMKNRSYALKKIRHALYLARGKGMSIVGLGGLTSSLSGGGTHLTDIDIHITTGHAYTAYNVTENLFKLVEIFKVPKSILKIAVVGAAGSVGSLSATLIARAGYANILLIDIKRKSDNVIELMKTMQNANPEANIICSFDIQDIQNCDFVITATNTPEALITTKIVRKGMIIIDDAQPSDIHRDVLKLSQVLVIEAGVVYTPEIKSNFNYGLKNRTDNFCCMAELLILASHEWDDHYIINRATIEHVDHISLLGKKLGFTVASFQNILESISHEKINTIKQIIRKKHGF